MMCRHKKLMIKTILLITVTMIPCSLQLTKEEELSDKELDILLKDPKYVSLATDMLKTEEKSTEKHKGGNLSHKPSERKKGFNLDLFKALDSEPEGNTTAEKEKKEVEDRFKSFDFITKQQARYLLEILKQPVFFNMLPNEAKTIVKATADNFSFKLGEGDKINDFIDTNLNNSPTSQAFIDPDGVIGRKGVLTIIDPENGDSKFVWTISNAKVLCFYQSQSLTTIVKLIRNTSLILKEVSATPCFLVASSRDSSDGTVLVCATSTQEKEVWVQTIKSNIKQT